jgi:hypothetical protein
MKIVHPYPATPSHVALALTVASYYFRIFISVLSPHYNTSIVITLILIMSRNYCKLASIAIGNNTRYL